MYNAYLKIIHYINIVNKVCLDLLSVNTKPAFENIRSHGTDVATIHNLHANRNGLAKYRSSSNIPATVECPPPDSLLTLLSKSFQIVSDPAGSLYSVLISGS